jgi:dTDP-glucose 4,6-dehydratase
MNMNIDNFNVKDKLIAVTGAAGFIGSHLTEALLERGARVKALARYNSRSDAGWLSGNQHKNLQIVFGDVRDRSLIDKFLAGCDAVFHLAALIGIPYSYSAPQSYIDTNVIGTLNILECAANHKLKRIVLTSTSEVYGTALTTPMNESHPLQAQSPYSASKISSDMLGMSYARSFGLPVIIVRPFNTYGPRQSMRAVIPTIVVQALTSKQIKLGNLTPVRDFNFVEDTANGFIAAAENGTPDARPYNLATGNGFSIKHTAETIMRLTGSKAELFSSNDRFRPDNSEVERLIGDSNRAQNELGWQPGFTFEQGLEKTVSWIEANLDKFPETQAQVK